MKIDTRKNKALKAFKKFGFELVRESPHLILKNPKSGESCSLPNHKTLKGSTVQKELTRLNIPKKEFWKEC